MSRREKIMDMVFIIFLVFILISVCSLLGTIREMEIRTRHGQDSIQEIKAELEEIKRNVEGVEEVKEQLEIIKNSIEDISIDLSNHITKADFKWGFNKDFEPPF